MSTAPRTAAPLSHPAAQPGPVAQPRRAAPPDPAAPSRSVPRPERPGPRLGPRTRRVGLIVHLAAMGTWLGMDVVLGVLVVTALSAAPADAAVLAVGIGTFVGAPLVAAAVLTLVSGIVLGVGSKYGLLRYPWVTVKLVLTVVLTVLVILVLVPTVAELSAQAQQALRAVTAGGFALDRQLIYPPIVSTTALLCAVGLSVIKPWGPRGRRRTGRTDRIGSSRRTDRTDRIGRPGRADRTDRTRGTVASTGAAR